MKLWPRRLRDLTRIGAIPQDGPEEALHKEVLVLAAVVMASLAVIWVVSYGLLGLYLAAAIPLTYQLVSVANLTVFAKTKRCRLFRASELWLSLVLPFLLQLSLGGFISSSGVILWSFTAPLGALLFLGRRSATRWFAAFLALIVLAALLDPLVADKTDQIPQWVIVAFFVNNILGVTGTSYLLLWYFVRERDRAAVMIAAERERSERLLLNVLPAPIADRLKAGEAVIADGAADVGVLFADIVGFTPLSAQLAPEGVVKLLNEGLLRVRCPGRRLGPGEDQDDRGCVHGRLRAACARFPSRRASRGDGAGPAAGGRTPGDAAPHRYRHRPGRCRVDRPPEVQLRPVG